MYETLVQLILTMLAEATTTKLHRDRDSRGFDPLKKDAQEGGTVAGSTRKDIEKRSGNPVVTDHCWDTAYVCRNLNRKKPGSMGERN